MPTVTYEEDRLVKRHRGTMPVILTCPHDGTECPPGVQARTKKATPDNCQFTTKSDLQTAFITQSVAQKILDLTGLSPYVVMASFDRKFIDANRADCPVNCAFTDPHAQPFYDEYHNRIAGFVNEIRVQNGNRGFLFDIHGKRLIVADPADIYLGTDNGGSLPPGFDRASIFMQHGLQGLLKSARHETGPAPAPLFQYRLSPADAKAKENSSVDGGFTVQRYGVFINSIQIEIADTIRRFDEKRLFLIEDLAFSIINFGRRHAPF
ncbi:MAG: N-formylglutamate amidohydrolase [Methylococcales bacterium]